MKPSVTIETKSDKMQKATFCILLVASLTIALFCLLGCGAKESSAADSSQSEGQGSATTASSEDEVSMLFAVTKDLPSDESAESNADKSSSDSDDAASRAANAEAIKPPIVEDFRESFIHGEKPAEFQKYIVLHDTEGDGDAASVIDWWDSNGNLVAAHFIINKDGSIYQAGPLDKIIHHAGFGDTGHNALYGVEDESRDDKVGTEPIGDWAADYGMNSYSIGIEMVHVSGSGDYPQAQLEALDKLIAYIDAYYGFESQIIDHKDWRSGNSDTSPEFAQYLTNYKNARNHLG